MVMLDDTGIDYETQTPFDVFLLKWNSVHKFYIENKDIFNQHSYNPINIIIDALCFFLGKHNFGIYYSQAENFYLIIDVDSKNNDGFFNYVIDSKMYNFMVEFLTLINGIEYKDRINPKNESAKKILIEDMRDELKSLERKRKSGIEEEHNDTIGTAINLICSESSSINYLNVGQYKIYQLLSTLKLKIKRMNYSNLMHGVYSGTIDYKTLNKEDLNWIS
jgi:hypothetical protein